MMNLVVLKTNKINKSKIKLMLFLTGFTTFKKTMKMREANLVSQSTIQVSNYVVEITIKEIQLQI